MTLSNDPAVAERAAELAIAVHHDEAAGRALDRWQALGARPAPMARARAELALDQGNAAEAKAQLERLVASGDKDAWRQFGRVLLGARDQAQAARLLEALAVPERLPADPKAWLAMSELGDKLGRPAYAREIAAAAAKRFHNAETYAWAAQMKFKDGDHDGAKALLRKALDQAPSNTRLRLAYAGMLSASGDDAAASRLLAHGHAGRRHLRPARGPGRPPPGPEGTGHPVPRTAAGAARGPRAEQLPAGPTGRDAAPRRRGAGLVRPGR